MQSNQVIGLASCGIVNKNGDIRIISDFIGSWLTEREISETNSKRPTLSWRHPSTRW